MVAAIVATEVLICVKFGWETITIPFPTHVTVFWLLFLGSWTAWTVWQFWPSIIGGFRINQDKETDSGINNADHRPKHE